WTEVGGLGEGQEEGEGEGRRGWDTLSGDGVQHSALGRIPRALEQVEPEVTLYEDVIDEEVEEFNDDGPGADDGEEDRTGPDGVGSDGVDDEGSEGEEEGQDLDSAGEK
ncbi:unnamed protein product, partial [Discosporangium mesarthrocarpum]